MKRKLITSTLIMMLAAFSVSGGVVAWFTSGTSGEMQTYSVGTLRISKPYLTDSSPEGPWQGSDEVQLTYGIDNIGDREVYIRVKPLVKYIGTQTEEAPYIIADPTEGWIKSGEWWYYGNLEYPSGLSKNGTLSVNLTVTLAPDAMGSLSFALEAEAILAMTAAMEELWKDDPYPWSVDGIPFLTPPVGEPEPGQEIDAGLTPEPESGANGDPVPEQESETAGEQSPDTVDDPAPEPAHDSNPEPESQFEEETLQE